MATIDPILLKFRDVFDLLIMPLIKTSP